jgi:transglutaminase-like putative cysteine protease
MQSIIVRHLTTYRYRQPVAFGEHRMMLRPRDSHEQRVIESRLVISPPPATLRFVQDPFGNHVGIAHFADRSRELFFESVVRVDHSPSDAPALDVDDVALAFPVDYGPDAAPDLAHCIVRRCADRGNRVGRWARQSVPADGGIGGFALLARLSQRIHRDFLYRRREAKGAQLPTETLRLGHGSCRDFAILMAEAARSLGFAARFASGYLAVPLEFPEDAAGSPHGSMHAWAQIFVPNRGWIDFDPTNGRAGAAELLTVAVVRDPRHATPLHGTFFGSASDLVGMEVEVSIARDAGSKPPDCAEIAVRPAASLHSEGAPRRLVPATIGSR